MNPLRDHPALAVHREPFAPMTDVDKLAVHLRYLLYLDPTAVSHERGDSTIVYYWSEHGTSEPGKVCCRIVLSPRGDHRRIDQIGFDPRAVAA